MRLGGNAVFKFDEKSNAQVLNRLKGGKVALQGCYKVLGSLGDGSIHALTSTNAASA